ncbi:MAG: CHAD domain-containing protein [Planctomycetia bacterium]|nr:CHAD domain-containing protein [Planctomycetia bacterium]
MKIAFETIAPPSIRMGRLDFVAHAPKWIIAKGGERVTEVAVRSLLVRLEAIQQYLPLAAMKAEESIEYVHQLRVSTRRADAALDMYRDLLPKWRVAWIERQLARIRRATNAARDDDVLARRLAKDEAPAAAALLKRVHEHRAEAQQAVREVYERMTKRKGRFDRRVEKLLKRVRLHGKYRKSKEPTYRDWAVEHLQPILAEFFAAADGDLSNTDRLHQFRIAGKKLRYALELLSAAFGSEFQNTAYPLLETLQNQLGQINDHASAEGRLSGWIEENEDAERGRYLTEMLRHEHEQLNLARQRFTTWWSGERQDQLRDAFEIVLGEHRTARKTE